jgi:hypothetical protein
MLHCKGNTEAYKATDSPTHSETLQRIAAPNEPMRTRVLKGIFVLGMRFGAREIIPFSICMRELRKKFHEKCVEGAYIPQKMRFLN